MKCRSVGIFVKAVVQHLHTLQCGPVRNLFHLWES